MQPASDTSRVANLLKHLVRVRSRGVTEPSAKRRLVAAHFDAVTEARSRGVTWQQIAKVLAEGGIRDDDGGEISWSSLKGLYHLERYARSKRPRRRSKKPKVTAQTTPLHASPPAAAGMPAESPGDEDDRPSGAFRVVPARSRT